LPRVKRGVTTHARHKKILKQTKGQELSRHLLYRRANESLLHSKYYATVGRKKRKDDFRRLWITRINAAARPLGLTYS
jgi:large subunit ribosomal protein L20